MGNLMSSMNTGVTGLRTNQAAINTSSHNLANVSTEGYVRQQVLMTDSNYNTISVTTKAIQQVGLGTDMAVVRQVRNTFLDKSYRMESGRLSFYEAQSEAVSEIENLMGETEGEQFQNTISDLWTALQELSKEPDSIVKRQVLLQEAGTFIKRATNISKQIEEYQVSLNTKILEKVDRINQIGKQIELLNYKISGAEVGMEQANDYRDARNMLLDELGSLANITYKENDRGIVSVNLEYKQFVMEDHVNELDVRTIDDTTSMLTVIWGKEGKEVFDIESGYSSSQNTDIGSLKGLLIARGGKKANYTDIPDKNDSKYYVVDEEGNEKFLQDKYDRDVNDYNNKIDSSVVMAMQAQFDQLVHGIVTTVNDALSPNADLGTVMNNMGFHVQNEDGTYSADATIEYTNIREVSGGTYEEKVTITATGKTSEITIKDREGNVIQNETKEDPDVTLETIKVWDEYHSGIGMDEDKTARETLFERKNMDRYSEATITCDGEIKTVWVYNEENPQDIYSLYTLGEIEINDELLKNPSKIPLSGNKNQGLQEAYDISILENLLDVWDDAFATLNPNVLTPSNFDNYYTSFIGDLADRGKIFNSAVDYQKTVVKNTDDQRQQTAGVSSDEELSNLIMYQYGYNANSRYITVIDEMLETLLNKLG